MTVRILQGDVRRHLAGLPDKSVQSVIGSPPYWGQRDYGHPDQMGLEATPQAYIKNLVGVYREVHRVLRDDGTLWLNMGDSYAGSGGTPTPQMGDLFKDRARGQAVICRSKRMPRGEGRWGGGDATAKPFLNGRGAPQNGPTKNTAPSPARLPAVRALRRKQLLGMPWRLALALQDDGWILRQDIIWSKPAPMPESAPDRCTTAHEYIFLLSKVSHDPQLWRAYDTREWSYAPDFSERVPHKLRPDVMVRRWRGFDYYWDADAIAEPTRPNTHLRVPKIGGWASSDTKHNAKAHNTAERRPGVSPKSAAPKSGIRANETFHASTTAILEMRNKRSVWTIAAEPFSGAHFATFPKKLVEPCILASCPKGGWVLDIFGGAGTTPLVADQLGRNGMMIELNPDYCEMARQRITRGLPLMESLVTIEPDLLQAAE